MKSSGIHSWLLKDLKYGEPAESIAIYILILIYTIISKKINREDLFKTESVGT